MKRKRAPRLLVSPNGSREYMTVTVARHTRERAEAIKRATGLALGRVVDAAMGTIEPCKECRGSGVVASSLGPDSAVCDACAGSRVVPSA